MQTKKSTMQCKPPATKNQPNPKVGVAVIYMYYSPTIALVLWCHLVVAPIVGTFGFCFGVHGNGSRLGRVVVFFGGKGCKKT